LRKTATSQGKAQLRFVCAEARKARAFHSTIKGYQPTPLLALDAFAQMLGVAKVLVKDESQAVRAQCIQDAWRLIRDCASAV
jgi:hypothetical protein